MKKQDKKYNKEEISYTFLAVCRPLDQTSLYIARAVIDHIINKCASHLSVEKEGFPYWVIFLIITPLQCGENVCRNLKNFSYLYFFLYKNP